jgi:thioredoxin-dependent adenylylsulfate APS reductase
MVLVDMAAKIDAKVRVFTLDTGRLPDETYQLMETVRARYGLPIELIYPDTAELERMTRAHGVNLFYRDPALRKLCCHIRKVRPMDRHLSTLQAWATGLRRAQSEERANLPRVEESGGRLKLNPLVDWPAGQVEDYLARNDVPRHPLYAKGYPSIGCQPCTRAVQPGEHERAGRWWWEQDASKECGLHLTPSGEIKRTLDVLLADILTN